MSYLFSVWCVLALGVLSMAGYRKMVSSREDDLVHLNDTDTKLVNNQKSVAEQLTWIDKWGQILTIVTVVFGLILAGWFLYNGWMTTSNQVQLQ